MIALYRRPLFVSTTDFFTDSRFFTDDRFFQYHHIPDAFLPQAVQTTYFRRRWVFEAIRSLLQDPTPANKKNASIEISAWYGTYQHPQITDHSGTVMAFPLLILD